MLLRNRLFLGIALAVGLVLPLGSWLAYRMSMNLSRDMMLQQSHFVAELLREKLVEPLDDVATLSKSRGHEGQWEQARLDPKTDHGITWIERSGRKEHVTLKKLLANLLEIPVMNGYSFLVDRYGTLIAVLPGGRIREAHISEVEAHSFFTGRRSTEETLATISDPVDRKPSQMVLLAADQFGLAIGVVFPEEIISAHLAGLARRMAKALVVLLVLVWLFSYWMSSRVTRPLEELTRAVRRSVKGDLSVPMLPSNIREVGQLSRAFATMRSDLAKYLEKLEHTTAEKARVVRELELARAIQGNADICLRLGGWVANARSLPAREVGGDFMDVFALDDHRIAVIVGDVSGKGIPAALYTLLARAGIKLGLSETGTPAAALRQANRLIALDNEDSVFVTALVAVVDTEAMNMVWARAGHPTPLNRAGSMTGPNGPPLGLLPEADYRETQTNLQREPYLFYTDGFPEAENEDAQFLGVPPMLSHLDDFGDLWTMLQTHRGAAEASDDATAVLLQPWSADQDEQPVARTE